MAEALGEERFDLVLTPFAGVNVYDPPSALDLKQLSEAEGVRSEGTYLAKMPDVETRGTDTGCDGHAVFSDGTHIAWFGGSLKRWTGTAWQTVTGGANAGTPGVRWSMAIFNDKCYMTNGTDKPLVYDKGTNSVTDIGITSPVSYIRLGFFWSDETWTGGTFDTTVYDPQKTDKDGEVKRSYKVEVTNTDVTISRSATLTFNTFPNGYTVRSNDFLHLWVRHADHTALADPALKITLTFPGTPNYNYEYYANKIALTMNKWGVITGVDENMKATRLRIPLSHFYDSTYSQYLTTIPSQLTGISITVFYGGKSNQVHIDNIKVDIAPPAIVPQARIFGDSSTRWAGNAGAPQYGGIGADTGPLVDTDIAQISFTGPATKQIYKDIPAGLRDFTVWDNETREPISPSDIIYFAFYITKGAGLNTVTLRIYYGGSGAYQEINVGGQINKADNSLSRVIIRRNEYTSVDWSDVRRVAIVVNYNSSTPSQVIVSNLHMRPGEYIKEFLDSEVTIGGSFQKETKIRPAGFAQSWSLTVTGTGGVTGDWPIASGKVNFERFDSFLNSDVYDYISFWMHHTNRAKIKEVEVRLVDAANNAVYYVIAQEALGGTKLEGSGSVVGNNVATYYTIQKRRFTQGQQGGFNWTQVNKIQFILRGAKKRGTATVYIQDVRMERAPGLSGMYHWKIRYVGEGVESEPISTVWYTQGYPRTDAIPLKGQSALLVNVRTPPSGPTNRLEIYRLRLGDGTYGLEKVVTMSNGAFPAKIDVGRVNEEDLTDTLEEEPHDSIEPEGSPVPRGKYNTFNGASHWVWGVSTYPNFVFFTPDYQPYVFSFMNSFQFAGRVMNVVIMYNAVFVFTTLGIKRITGSRVYHYDFQEIPAWDRAVTKLPGGYMAFATRDNVFLFDGGNITPIGLPVRPVMMDATDIELSSWRDYLLLSADTSKGPQTWAFYMRTRTWHKWMDRRLNGVVDLNGTLYAMDHNGYVVTCNGKAALDRASVTTAHMFAQELRKVRVERVSVMASGGGDITVVPLINGQPLEDVTGYPVAKTFALAEYPKRYDTWLAGITSNSKLVEAGLGNTVAVRLLFTGSADGANLYSVVLSGVKAPGPGVD